MNIIKYAFYFLVDSLVSISICLFIKKFVSSLNKIKEKIQETVSTKIDLKTSAIKESSAGEADGNVKNIRKTGI